MMPYLLTLAAGLLVGIVYSLPGVRSPAPPVIALVGVLGILIGGQALPGTKRLAEEGRLARFIRRSCARHVLGNLPANKDRDA